MDSATEKYPVCPERNTAAAFRWFYEPASALHFLKGRTPPRRAAAVPLPAAPAQARTLGRR
jgi:hypothetical protein